MAEAAPSGSSLPQPGMMTITVRQTKDAALALELKLALLDAKIARHCDSEYDSATYLSWVGHLRRLYQTLGIGRPAPKFAELMKSPPKPRKTEAA